jgi:uncharacterized protein YcfJ
MNSQMMTNQPLGLKAELALEAAASKNVIEEIKK